MIRKTLLCRRILACTLALGIISTVFVSSQVEAQNWWSRIVAPFRRNREIGAASGRGGRGAAVRDPDLCPRVQTPLIALVPNRDEPIKTSEAHPIFWFYIPYKLSEKLEKNTLKFVLQDEQNTDVYEAAFTMREATTQRGIIGLRLPDQKAALLVGRTYHWYFLIYCDDPERIYEPAFVEGVIQREELEVNLSDEFDQSDPQSWLIARAEAGLWYDILAALAEFRQTNPDNSDLAIAWEEVLQGIDLDDIDDAPIIGRYYVPPEDISSEN